MFSCLNDVLLVFLYLLRTIWNFLFKSYPNVLMQLFVIFLFTDSFFQEPQGSKCLRHVHSL